jgi:hypothetical protein
MCKYLDLINCPYRRNYSVYEEGLKIFEIDIIIPNGLIECKTSCASHNTKQLERYSRFNLPIYLFIDNCSELDKETLRKSFETNEQIKTKITIITNPEEIFPHLVKKLDYFITSPHYLYAFITDSKHKGATCWIEKFSYYKTVLIMSEEEKKLLEGFEFKIVDSLEYVNGGKYSEELDFEDSDLRGDNVKKDKILFGIYSLTNNPTVVYGLPAKNLNYNKKLSKSNLDKIVNLYSKVFRAEIGRDQDLMTISDSYPNKLIEGITTWCICKKHFIYSNYRKNLCGGKKKLCDCKKNYYFEKHDCEFQTKKLKYYVKDDII